MKLELKPGKYLLAVSGGVDSMALLDILASSHEPRATSRIPDFRLPTSGFRLTVAHFDHRMRPGSDKDALFVAKAANQYGLEFVGASATKIPKNEAEAREARYKFLMAKAKGRGAKIITAHHQDDLIETAFINLLRGTGRRGLSAIASNPDVIRPLLDMPKAKILEYAKRQKLRWREDPTNQQTDYLRNYIRHNIMPKLTIEQRRAVLSNLDDLTDLNGVLDKELDDLLQNISAEGKLNRRQFIALPPEIAKEAMAEFLRQAGLRQFDSRDIERLTIAVKTAKNGTKHDVLQGRQLVVGSQFVHLSNSGR